jgi:Mg2+-importing ATPase
VTGVITGKQLEELIGTQKVDPLASPVASPRGSPNASQVDLRIDDGQKPAVTNKPLDPKKERERILDEISSRTTIFAKLTPLQKAEVVSSLRRQGHVVGFLGDGINDAAALREADVGISVDSAVDVAKENADIILLEKSLMVLVKGVRQGRLTYGNTIKYIKMTASSNFGNVFSVLIASAWLPFLPMLPIHLVTQNLLYDFTQVIIPWDNMDEDFLAKPRNWSANDIGKFMVSASLN